MTYIANCHKPQRFISVKLRCVTSHVLCLTKSVVCQPSGVVLVFRYNILHYRGNRVISRNRITVILGSESYKILWAPTFCDIIWILHHYYDYTPSVGSFLFVALSSMNA